MAKLPLNVRGVPGEVAMSLASRLAAANQLGMADFLQDMGIKPLDLLKGDRISITLLAALAGQEARQVLADTPQLEVDALIYRRHRFKSAKGQGQKVRICRACMKERPAILGIWLLEDLGLCMRHHLPLEILWEKSKPLERFDIAAQAVNLPESALQQRDPTEFEHWLWDRLAGQTGPSHWLDQFELGAAATFCAVLGRTLMTSAYPKWLKLPHGTEHLPAQIGYDACRGGEAGLRQALVDHQQKLGRPEQGLKKILGPIYQMFDTAALPEGLAPFKAILRSHIQESWPLSPGDRLWQDSVLKRRHISLLRASEVLAIDVPTLSRQLKLPQEGAAAEWFLVNVEALAPHRRLLDEEQFRGALTLSSPIFDVLSELGAFDRAKVAGLYDPLQGLAVLDQLFLGAEPIYVAMHSWRPLRRAVKEAGMSLHTLMRLLLDRQLRVGKYTLYQGFDGILVDLSSLSEGLISLDICARLFGLPLSQLRQFWRGQEDQTLRPTGRLYLSPKTKMQAAMSREEVHAFQREFISFSRLSVELALEPDALREWISGRGIHPLPLCPDLFRRADVFKP